MALRPDPWVTQDRERANLAHSFTHVVWRDAPRTCAMWVRSSVARMEGVHDMGGMDGFGAVVTADGELSHHEPWELRAQALALLISGGSVRPWIERLHPADYLNASYYQRWLMAAEHAVIERGVVTAPELQQWQDRFATDATEVPPIVHNAELTAGIDHVMTHNDRMPPAVDPTFRVGDVVEVRRMRTKEQNRCPRYVRGARGHIEAICGNDLLPGSPTRGRGPMYTVEFSSTDLFGVGAEPSFAVLIDLCQHYLTLVDQAGADERNST